MRKVLGTLQKQDITSNPITDLSTIWEGEEVISYCTYCYTIYSATKDDLTQNYSFALWMLCPLCGERHQPYRKTKEKMLHYQWWLEHDRQALEPVPEQTVSKSADGQLSPYVCFVLGGIVGLLICLMAGWIPI